MDDVVIVAALRTAVGKFGGSLSKVAAADLGASVIKALLEKTGVDPATISEVILGQVLTAGVGQNAARQAVIKAGLPDTIPAFTINKVCGSGLKATHLATQAIRCGDADIIIAGGQENMSASPHVLNNSRDGFRMGDAKLVDTMIVDGLWDVYNQYHMGVTAENVAKQFNISRADQEKLAYVSQMKAAEAQREGRLRDEIVPVKTPDGIVDQDGTLRPATTLEGLAVLEPGDLTVDVLDENGTLLARSNPLRVADASSKDVHYWADTHGQSDETLGTNSAREYFAFGRDRALIDVMSHQGNDFQITGDFWRDLNIATAEFDEPGRFVCIPGYEWSANTAVGGDRNVMYRREGESIHRSSHAQITEGGDMADEASDAHEAGALFEKLAGKDCVVMAHVGGRYADITYSHDGKLETAV